MVSLLTSFARTMTERPALLLRIAPTAKPGRLADECRAASAIRKNGTDHDATGCRLLQAVAATHVRARTISHARTPGTIPSSRCQTTRRQPIIRTAANKCSHGRDKATDWWSQSGSNRRPHACKARALPAELWPLSQMLSNRPVSPPS